MYHPLLGDKLLFQIDTGLDQYTVSTKSFLYPVRAVVRDVLLGFL